MIESAAQKKTPIPIWASPADALTWGISTPNGDDRRWRREQFEAVQPHAALALAKRYKRTAVATSMRDANLELLATTTRCQIPGLPNLDCGNDDIRCLADQRSRTCSRFAGRQEKESWCLRSGIEPPIPAISDAIACRRMDSRSWWTRRLRNIRDRRNESLAIELGAVCATSSKYASKAAVKQYRTRQRACMEFLQQLTLINELGDTLALVDIIEKSLANPYVRRSEMMCRMFGVEEVARESGLAAVFVTITCPSRMHAYHRNGTPNRKYDGTDPRTANAHLGGVWKRIRAAMQRTGISPIGFRVAEPHHDATPHWHLLLFIPPEQIAAVKGLINRYALEDSPDESGAAARRVTFEDIDYERGSATAYVAKYISKNIDGYGLDDENAGNAAAAVRTWASIWGIRQFQFFGSPPIGPWRELRHLHSPVHGTIEKLRRAADASCFAEYIRLQGGLGRKAEDYARVAIIAEEQGEESIAGPAESAVAAPRGAIIRIRFGNEETRFRRHVWAVVPTLALGRDYLEFCQ